MHSKLGFLCVLPLLLDDLDPGQAGLLRYADGACGACGHEVDVLGQLLRVALGFREDLVDLRHPAMVRGDVPLCWSLLLLLTTSTIPTPILNTATTITLHLPRILSPRSSTLVVVSVAVK